MPSRVLAALCSLLLIGGALAKGSGGGYGFAHGGLNGRRMLAQSSLLSSIGKGGPYTDWTVPCGPGRARCPSLFLASHGYQCTTLNRQACCKQGDGKQCALAFAWALVPTPKSWRGRNLVGKGAGAASPSPSPAPPPTKPSNTTTPVKPTNATAPTSPTPASPPPAKPIQLTPLELLAYNLTETQPPAGYVLVNSTKTQQSTKTIGGAVGAVVGQQASAANSTQQQASGANSTQQQASGANSTQQQQQQGQEPRDTSGELPGEGEQQAGSESQGGSESQSGTASGQQETGGQQGGKGGGGGKKPGRNGGTSGSDGKKGGGKKKGKGGKGRSDKKKWRGNGSDEDPSDSNGSSSGGSKGGSKQDKEADGTSSSGGGKWQKATATYYHSYPPCCHDSGADQSECDDFSGCVWEGQFAGLGHKPESWVKKNNIVSFFEAPNSSNRKEWDKKWNGKKLRLKHPDTGDTMDVTVVDTCDDEDCEGCCTENARKNGGLLIDMEINTARRFWGAKKVRGLAGIQFQILED
ncbi:hypothetical protein C2E21_9138 [Chlorella sorokiniana]|uniref:Uncharacterized protein n=1 Tax=Chlorella sorokiniana TaxID=3076 RepID=A0A2P6TCE2_CHLSO|nr:hypothetical protein C2E21_9138 [Chlorella sorokiniana]|eukprot:PRW20305.1 hypothetical protein C2E21_9138 [Chlorella sorokiniana]